MKISKKNRIKNYLLGGNAITQKIAINLFDSYRLSSVIFKLKNEGLSIETKIKRTDTGSSFAEYKIKGTYS